MVIIGYPIPFTPKGSLKFLLGLNFGIWFHYPIRSGMEISFNNPLGWETNQGRPHYLMVGSKDNLLHLRTLYFSQFTNFIYAL